MKTLKATALVPGKRYVLHENVTAEFVKLDENNQPEFINQQPEYFFSEDNGIVYLCGEHTFYEKEEGDD